MNNSYEKYVITNGGGFCCKSAAWECIGICLICGGEDCDCGGDLDRCEGTCKHPLGGYMPSSFNGKSSSSSSFQRTANLFTTDHPKMTSRINQGKMTMEPPKLRRSYAFMPGQTEVEHAAMTQRLDIANEAAGLSTSLSLAPTPSTSTSMAYDPLSPPYPVEDTESPKSKKRALDRALMPPPPARKPKRARKLKVIEKTVGGKTVYEITKPNGDIILTRELNFE